MKVIEELGNGSHPFRFFWLSVDGKAACIASLFFNGDHCGIFDVLTHEDHRKKGYAFRLMKYVLSYAKKHGSAYMCLTASSPEAVNLYRKMGFDNFGDYECYEFKSQNHFRYCHNL